MSEYMHTIIHDCQMKDVNAHFQPRLEEEELTFAGGWEKLEDNMENYCLQDRKAVYGVWKREKHVENTQRTDQWLKE